jgi:hypothetical protein
MILRSAVVLVLCSLSSARAETDDVIAKGYPVERYQGIWERNPFQWVTPAKVTAEPNFAQDLVLTSWLSQGGKEVVFVQNRKTQESEKITAEPNARQLRIVSIQPDPNPEKVSVVLSNGTEQGTVKFNTEPPKIEAAPNQPVQGGVAQGQRLPRRQQSSKVQQASAAGSQSVNSSRYPMPPGMNQYNQHHYGEYIRQQQEQKKQQQQWQEMQRSAQQQ